MEVKTHQPTTPTQKGEAPQRFLSAIRTMSYLRSERLRRNGLEGLSFGVYISQKDIEKYYFIYPINDRKTEIAKLIQAGELRVTEGRNQVGRRIFLYKALRPGPIDLEALPFFHHEYDELTEWIRDSLRLAELEGEAPEYFKLFAENKHKHIDQFFTVDTFAGRIHTPVTSLPGETRRRLLLAGSLTCSLDVAQMQPELLGKILKDNIGPNFFSEALDTGRDIYDMIAQRLTLATRSEAKEKFFQITFAPPSSELAALFGNDEWIRWINEYKRKDIPANPHGKDKPHSNLAWLLQSEEVRLMRKIWHELKRERIRFLTVHDEIIISIHHARKAESIMTRQLDQVLRCYKINKTP